MRRLLSVLLILIVFSGECYAQQWPDSVDISPFGNGIHFFRMGKLDDKKFKVNLAIRKDEVFSNTIPPNDERFELQNPHFNPWHDTDFENQHLTVEILKNGTIETDDLFKVDTDFLNRRLTSKSLLALGNVQLNSSSKSKVKDLYLISGYGRPNIEAFQNLQSLTIQNRLEKTHINFKSDEIGGYYYANLSNPGDLTLMDEISNSTELKNLRIEFERNEPEYHTNMNTFCLQGLNESLFSSPNLRTAYLNGIHYLPIDYKGIQKLDYFEASYVNSPELLNIALAFYLAKKDTSEGDWFFWLNNLVDLEKSNIDVSNGMVETYYKNGVMLSQGEMVNDKPNGPWKFWYADGQLCQERQYTFGIRSGSWVFRNDAPYYNVDTSMVLKYENGKLVHRMNYSMMHTSPCFQPEPSYETNLTSEYQLNWKADSLVTVSKTKQFDNLKGSLENWMFDLENWTYELTEICNGDTISIRKSFGKTGQIAHKVTGTEKVRNWRGLSEIFWSLDLRTCHFEQINYSLDKKTSEKFVPKIEMEYWKCPE